MFAKLREFIEWLRDLADLYFDVQEAKRYRYVPLAQRGGKDGGGGGAAPPSSQTVNQTNLPEYAKPYYLSLMDRATTQSQTPYPVYPGQQVANLSGLQNTAIGMAGSIAGDPNLTQTWGTGQGLAEQSGIGSLGIGQSLPGQVNQIYSPSNVASWMNPYQQGVIDIAKDQSNRQFAQQENQASAQASAHGAFGGYRDQLRESEDQRNQNILLNNIQTQGDQQSYQQAMQAMGQQAQTALGAGQLGLAGFGQAAQSGAALGQLGAGELGARQTALSDAQTLGALQQQQEQGQLTSSYQNFMNAGDYPRQQLEFLSGILRGVPVSASSNVSTYAPPPNPYSQLLGMGIGAAGLSKMMS